MFCVLNSSSRYDLYVRSAGRQGARLLVGSVGNSRKLESKFRLPAPLNGNCQRVGLIRHPRGRQPCNREASAGEIDRISPMTSGCGAGEGIAENSIGCGIGSNANPEQISTPCQAKHEGAYERMFNLHLFARE